MKKYIYEFLQDEKGTEIIEWLSILAVTVVLISVVVAIGAKAKSILTAAAGYL